MITRRMTIGAACYLFDSGDVRRMCGSVRPRDLSAMPRNTVTNLTFSVSPGMGWNCTIPLVGVWTDTIAADIVKLLKNVITETHGLCPYPDGRIRDMRQLSQ